MNKPPLPQRPESSDERERAFIDSRQVQSKGTQDRLVGEQLLREGNLSNLLEIFQVFLAIVPVRVRIGISKVKCSARAEAAEHLRPAGGEKQGGDYRGDGRSGVGAGRPKHTRPYIVRKRKQRKKRRTQFKVEPAQLVKPCIYTHLFYSYWLIHLTCQTLF